eukprot:IDg3835t1
MRAMLTRHLRGLGMAIPNTEVYHMHRRWSLLFKKKTCTVPVLREMCRTRGLARNLRKSDAISALYCAAVETADVQDDDMYLGSANGTSKIYVDCMKKAPVEEVSRTAARRSTNFNLKDFARLMTVLTYDKNVRNALLESGSKRTRAELDAHGRANVANMDLDDVAIADWRPKPMCQLNTKRIVDVLRCSLALNVVFFVTDVSEQK